MANCCSCRHTVEKKESKTKSENIISQSNDKDGTQWDNINENLKLSPRPLYLDPFRRPLITFPTSENSQHFSVARKYKINQQILDGYLDPSEAITAPPIFPYLKLEKDKIGKDYNGRYIFELPEGQYKCPVHNKSIDTPRIFGCCTCLKWEKEKEARERRKVFKLYKRPKPWLLSRHTDFDFISQW